MSCYIITYDLKQPADSRYEALYQAIRDYLTWAHITESTWAVVTEQTAVQVRDNLDKHLNSQDRICVVQSAGVGAWRNTQCKSEWLKENL